MRTRLWLALMVAVLAFLAIKAGVLSPPRMTPGGDDGAFQKTMVQKSPGNLKSWELGQEVAVPLKTAEIESTEDAPPEPDPMVQALRARLLKKNVVAGEALLTFRSKEALERFTRRASSLGLVTLGTIPQLNSARVRYGTVEGLSDAITANGADYTDVEGNLWLSIPLRPPTPPQPDSNNEGGAAASGRAMMSAINAEGDRTHWGDRVTVAVVDTGVLAHPTFGENQVTHVDLVNDGLAFDSHGTSVASLVGGQDPQAPGVAPGARILDIRVANPEGYTVSSVLAEGIIEAADRGAQVINVSFGGNGDSQIVRQAVDYAVQRGAVVVAAAGNEAYDQIAFPAAYESVISVGSADANGQQAYFSNSGHGLDLVAPGVGVLTAWDTDKIARVSGTSQSTALASGAAAAYVGWGVSPNEVAARLKADSRPLDSSAERVGAGLLTIKPPTGR
jgi:Subtilase family